MKEITLCKDVFGNIYKVPTEDLKIRVGVYAVIIKDNKILLTRQWDGYGLIGGSIEKGETVEEAIIREVKEETGLDIVPDKIIYQTTTFFKRDENSEPHHSVQLYFNHSKISGAITNKNITQSEKKYTYSIPEWVDINNINEIVFRHSVDLKTILKAYNENCKNNKKEEI